MKKILTTFLLLFMAINLFAQSTTTDSTPDLFYSHNRIYVVVACAAIVLIGLLLYLFTIDNRLKKLEKNSGSKN